jgi:hypothetical protein
MALNTVRLRRRHSMPRRTAARREAHGAQPCGIAQEAFGADHRVALARPLLQRQFRPLEAHSARRRPLRCVRECLTAGKACRKFILHALKCILYARFHELGIALLTKGCPHTGASLPEPLRRSRWFARSARGRTRRNSSGSHSGQVAQQTAPRRLSEGAAQRVKSLSLQRISSHVNCSRITCIMQAT